MEATTQVLDREEITATPGSAAKLIREVRAKTRRQFSAEDKIRIVHHKQFQLKIQKIFRRSHYFYNSLFARQGSSNDKTLVN